MSSEDARNDHNKKKEGDEEEEKEEVGQGGEVPKKRIRLSPMPLTDDDAGDQTRPLQVPAGDLPAGRSESNLDDGAEQAVGEEEGEEKQKRNGDDDDDDEMAGADSNQVISFKVVGRDGEVLHQFHPEFTHQLFEDETIHGYSDLSISIFLSLSLECYVEFSFSDCLPATTASPEGIADSHEENFEKLEVLSFSALKRKVSDFTPSEPVSLAAFLKVVPNAEIPPAMLQSPVLGVSHCRRFCFSQADLGNDTEREFADRLQNFAFFFIDGAERVDLADPRWQWITLWARVDESEVCSAESVVDGTVCRPRQRTSLATLTASQPGATFVAAGYMTLYHFINPMKPRPKCLRVCQVLVLPPFQRQGLGAMLFEEASSGPGFGAAPDVLEVTVESPCPGFVRLRDTVDLDRFIELCITKCRDGKVSKDQRAAAATAAAAADAIDGVSFSDLLAGVAPTRSWTPALATQLQDELHMTARQSRRCFDALLFASVRNNAESLKEFRLGVKRRLYHAAVAQVEDLGLDGEAAVKKTKAILEEEFHQLCEVYSATLSSVLRKRKRMKERK